MLKKLFGWLFHPGLWTVIGLACLALLIWIGGPLLALGSWRPLEAEAARWLMIGLVFGLWLLRQLARLLRSRLANRRLLDALVPAPPTPAVNPAGPEDPNLVTVRERFARALAELQAAPVGQGQGGARRRFGRHRYVYQLPWYVFIGPPGSGKTTALLNAGLSFPLARSLGSDPVRGVAGTRHCDWWFTDQAVLIDTAGRYTTQDSDAAGDAREWAEFLLQLKRHRPRQPINGALVTVSATDLLTLPAPDLAGQAVAVRTRLAELLTTLDNRFPVYVLVTKLDQVAGFNEFFANLDTEQRSQVWGTTFAFDEQQSRRKLPDKTGNGVFDLEAFDQRFTDLVTRIADRTLERLQAEREPTNRAAIFSFGHQLAALRAPLDAFLNEAFSPSSLTRQPLIRGVYLTSATQEGTPIDRVLAILARRLGLSRPDRTALRPTGRAYFLKRPLVDVVFAESALAGTNLTWERRQRRLKWTAACAALGIGLLVLGGWTRSYLGNVGYVDAVADQAAAAARSMPPLRSLRADPVLLLERLESTRQVAHAGDVNPERPPLALRWGLFQGNKLDDGADQTYQALLAESLGPMIADRVARALAGTSNNPEMRYETLKTAVMLNEPARLDPDAVKAWIALDLAASPPVLDATQRARLLSHLDALFERPGLAGTVPIDGRVIARVRQSLVATPLPQRAYSRLKRLRIGADLPEFRITQAGGPSATAVFARKSSRPLTEGVPGVFRYDGYHLAFATAVGPIVETLATEEPWVLGLAGSDNARRATTPAGRAQLVDEVKRLYLADYVRAWDQFLADIRLQPSTSLAQSIQIARILSAPDSPLILLMRAIVRETTLTVDQTGAPDENRVAAVVDKVGSAVRTASDRLGALVNPETQAQPTNRARGDAAPIEKLVVDDRFQYLRDYVKAPAPGVPAPIEQTSVLFNDIYTMLVATERAVRSGDLPPGNDVALKIRTDGGRLQEPMRSMVEELASAGNNQALGATRRNLSRSLSAQVSETCNNAIAGRYPFRPGSPTDVTAEDFAKVFGPAGILDDFFQKSLAPVVDTTSRPWRFRQVGDAPLAGDTKTLAQFERAQVIRNVFFVAGRGPTLKLELRPIELDPAILQLNVDIDGQVLTYAHGPPVPRSVTWPGTAGSNQIRIQASPPGSGGGGLLFEGPWALHRMFDRARITASRQPERFLATFDLGGRRVVLEVTTSSIANPFNLKELQQFQCPQSL